MLVPIGVFGLRKSDVKKRLEIGPKSVDQTSICNKEIKNENKLIVRAD